MKMSNTYESLDTHQDNPFYFKEVTTRGPAELFSEHGVHGELGHPDPCGEKGTPGVSDCTPESFAIAQMCDSIKELLLEKNRKYGNSALNPKRIFSKASFKEQLLVRIDDKLSRIANQSSDEDEDVYKDLVGYLILLMVANKSVKC